MKILFINSAQYDYLQDIVFSGLVKTLGQKNIIEVPRNLKYHLPYKTYPKNIGYVKNSFIQSFIHSKSNYDAVIVGACKPDAFSVYINHALSIPASVPVIFIDGGDKSEIGGDLARLGHSYLYEEAISKRPFDLIFKREYKLDKKYPSNVYPLPFGFNLDRIPKIDNHRKYDVAFWANESHPIRTKALQLLEGKFDCDSNGTSLGKNIYNFKRKGKEYLKELAACKINLSLRGGGFDTLRYWEIPAVGSMLLSEPADILIPNNFIHEKHAVFCDSSLDDLISICEYYLKEDAKREKITENGQLHLKMHHTDIQRARYIMDTTFVN